eukprot:CAMPEP_0184499174 /NCGR_PEP_ID=MMETSP0113_2-20130426/40849_1 /TAXON_ID=91329 /ORGANISM="Norrisiella sphaerica, Strain BC52" /LENGTH=190 /DNA_ID=CAMNT_0026886995 /DNA_START=105 /DNA_END=677 /DNA_ORIENTATION=+
MKKQRVWTYKGIGWLAKHFTDDERKEEVKSFRSGKTHTLILGDEYIDLLLPMSHMIGVVIHFDFPSSLEQYKIRGEICDGLAPLAVAKDSEKQTPSGPNPSLPKSKNAGGQLDPGFTAREGRVMVLLYDKDKDSMTTLDTIRKSPGAVRKDIMEEKSEDVGYPDEGAGDPFTNALSFVTGEDDDDDLADS